MTNKHIAPYKAAIAEAKASFLEIAQAEGNLVSYKKEAIFAMQAIERNDSLMKSSRQSIRDAVINVASIGLSLNPALQLAYLLPRDGICCLDISYRGLLKLATDSGSIRYATAEVVRSHDHFVWKSRFELPDHEYSPFASDEERGPIIGVYAAAKTHDGEWLVEPMSREEIERVKAASKAKRQPAWDQWYGEMAKKAAIKRAQKTWPRTERLAKAVHVLNEHEGSREDALSGVDQYAVRSKGETIDAEAVVVDEETGEVQPAEDAPVAPLTDGQIRVIRSKLNACGITEDALFQQFGIGAYNELAASQANDILAWIGENAA